MLPINQSKVRSNMQILQAYLREMIKKASGNKDHFKKLIDDYRISNQFEKAFNSFNGFCSQYENERALNHLLECVQTIIKNIEEIISCKTKPDKYDYELSILCYAQSILYIPNLDYFVTEVVQKLWKKETVENLKFSPKIPDSMIHIKPRSQFTLEELHLFAHTFEKELSMNFAWFYNNFPINNQNLPEKTSQVVVLGKKIFMKTPEPPRPSVPEYKGDSSVLPILPPVKKDTYLQLNKFVEDSIQKWNTWKFVV